MSFLEWFLKPANPGPVGSLEVNSPEPDDDEPPKKWLIWLAIIAGLILVGIGLCWTFYDFLYTTGWHISLKLCALGLYMLISHSVTARPDYTNVGWLGGLMDNPFRISDDYNRLLIYLQALLLPGKLMAYSLIISWLLVQYIRKRLKKQ